MELKDTGTSTLLRNKGYKEIYREIRGAVDLCHRDGSLKKAVAENPAKYIHQACLSPRHFSVGALSSKWWVVQVGCPVGI